MRDDTGGRERNVESTPGQAGLTTTSGCHHVIRRSTATATFDVDALGAVAGSKNAAAGEPSPPEEPDAPPAPPPVTPNGEVLRRGSHGSGL